jgi:multidrug efflux pump subunit AcrB
MLGVTFGAMAGSIALYIVIPKGFFPVQDNGQIACTVEAAQDISFAAFRKKDMQVDDVILHDPAVRATAGFINGGSNQGRIWTNLKPLDERRIGVQEIIARLRRKISRIEGVNLFMQASQELRIGAHSSKSTYQYTMQGPDLKELAYWSDALMKELSRIPHFQDVTSDLQSSGLQARIVIDRAAAGRMGIDERDIDNTLYDAFGQRQVSTIYTDLTQHHVILEARPRFQLDPRYLDVIYVKSDSGRMVPLSAFARQELGNTPLSINHVGQFPAVTLSFNLDPGYSLGEATEEIDNAAARLRVPGSIRGSFQGMARAFEQSLATEPLLILAALLAIYIILGMLYESVLHPLTILSTLPSAGVGALLALLITGYDLSIVAFIGIILLIGLVMKNAIMMIDFALEVERNEELGPEESIYRACVVRFRPIMMTTLAALFGALPLALEGGVGAELHKPLGISIVGGLIVSQLLTLFTTPVIYLTLDRLRRRREGGQSHEAEKAAAAAAPSAAGG